MIVPKRYTWEQVVKPLRELCTLANDDLPECREELRAEHRKQVTVYHYRKLGYGHFGLDNFSAHQKVLWTTDFELAARKWTRREHISEALKQIEKENVDNFGSTENANAVVWRLASETVAQLLKGADTKGALGYIRQKLFASKLRYCTTLRCPLFGCVLPAETFTYHGQGLEFQLRRPGRRDLCFISPGPMFELASNLPDAILTINCNPQRVRESRLVGAVVGALMMFKAGCVSHGDFEIIEHYLTGGNINMTDGQGSRRPKSKMVVRLYPADFADLSKHLNAVLPYLVSLNDEDETAPLSLAVSAYLQAVYEPSIWEKQVANAVMAIEALIMGDSHTDLKYRAAFRSAKFASACGYDPRHVRVLVELAYNLRSKYVHGSRCDKQTRSKVIKLAGSESGFCQQICDVVRSQILAYSLLTIHKPTLQKQLDDAMLATKDDRLLLNMLSSVRKINQPFACAQPFFDHFNYLQYEDRSDLLPIIYRT